MTKLIKITDGRSSGRLIQVKFGSTPPSMNMQLIRTALVATKPMTKKTDTKMR